MLHDDLYMLDNEMHDMLRLLSSVMNDVMYESLCMHVISVIC